MTARYMRGLSSGQVLALVLVAALAVAILVLWAVPAWLTRYPSQGLTTAERLKATNDVRTPLVALLVAFGAAGTLLFTARTYTLNREGHVTDRYSKAVGQLGETSSPVRIGGVYALERIGIDSPKDRITIIYVLGAFIRERSKVMRERQDEPPEDVKAAIRVAGRLLSTTPNVVLDLRGADLRNADLSSLREAQLAREGANVKGARLPDPAKST
jgi:hypothetical protein